VCGKADTKAFAVAAHRSDQVFLPVLENAVKAAKLRSTLGVFEKSKFLFNLPGQLMENINAVGQAFSICAVC
jgi:exocyst complex component 2